MTDEQDRLREERIKRWSESPIGKLYAEGWSISFDKDAPPLGVRDGSNTEPMTATELLTQLLGVDWGNRSQEERQVAVNEWLKQNTPDTLMRLSLKGHGLI